MPITLSTAARPSMLLTSHLCELSPADGDAPPGGGALGGAADPAGEDSVGICAVGDSAGECAAALEGGWGAASLTDAPSHSAGSVGGISAPISQKRGMKIPIRNIIQWPFLIAVRPSTISRTT